MQRIESDSYSINHNNLPRFMVMLYTVIVLILISPPLYNIAMARYIMIIAMVIWIGMDVYRKRYKISKIGVIVFLFIICSVIKTMLDTGSLINGRITKIYYYCFFVIAYTSIEYELEYYKKSLWAFMFVSPIWVIISIFYGLSVENLFRGLSGSGLYDTEMYSSLGVVGYDYIYSIVICLPVFLGLLINKKALTRIQLFIVILNLVLNIILISIANYGLAFFSMFICLLLFLLNKGNGITPNRIIVIIIATLLLVLILTNNQLFFMPLLRLLSGTYYESKIQDLYYSINTGSVFGRTEIWSNAIKEFVDNPIWGNGFKNTVNTHSEMLYSLVYYGVFISCLEFYILFYPFKLLTVSNQLIKRVRLSVLIGFIIVTMFDPAGSTVGAVLVTLYGISKYYLLDMEMCTP